MVGGLVERIRVLIERLLAIRVVENSVILAAQTFLALFPLMILSYALLPSGLANGLADALRGRLGLGESTDAVDSLLADRGSLRQSLSLLSVVIVIGSATAFTRAVQRVYQNAWDLPKLGFRGAWRGLVWVVGVVVYVGVVGMIKRVVNGDASVLSSILFGLVIWWWTPYLLLGGRVTWRALLPGAVVTAIGQTAVTLVSVIYLPRTLHNNEVSFGPIGLAFAIESWLIVVSGALVVTIALGAALGQDPGPFGRWVRGSAEPGAWRRRPDG